MTIKQHLALHDKQIAAIRKLILQSVRMEIRASLKDLIDEAMEAKLDG